MCGWCMWLVYVWLVHVVGVYVWLVRVVCFSKKQSLFFLSVSHITCAQMFCVWVTTWHGEVLCGV